MNAVASAVVRFCLAAAFALVTEASVSGQSSTIPEQPLLGSALPDDMLRQLPASGNPFAVFDAMQTEVISDRFVAGGLNSAAPPRAGGFLNSWTQTQIRFGDVTITDPRTGGTPLLVPLLPVFSRMHVAVGALGLDESASALSMTLEPIRAGAHWVRSFEGSLTGGFLTPAAIQPVPASDERTDYVRYFRTNAIFFRVCSTQASGVACGVSNAIHPSYPLALTAGSALVQSIRPGSSISLLPFLRCIWQMFAPKTSRPFTPSPGCPM